MQIDDGSLRKGGPSRDNPYLPLRLLVLIPASPNISMRGSRTVAKQSLLKQGRYLDDSGHPLLSLRYSTLHLYPGIAPAHQNAGEGRRHEAPISAARVMAGCGGALAVLWVCAIQVTRSSPSATQPYGCTQL